MSTWVNLQQRKSLDTFPYIYEPGSQRLSSTAVYAPCPLTFRENLDDCAFGHGAYTAKR